MEKTRLFFDKKGNALNVWFDDPSLEYICEETGDDVILVKDKTGRVIGFEKLNFLKERDKAKEVHIPLEVELA